MTRKQWIAIIGAIFVFGLAAYYASKLGGAEPGISSSNKRFAAKPGTTRDRARFMVSSARAPGALETDPPDASPDSNARETPPSGLIEQALEALDDLTPEGQLAVLQDQLKRALPTSLSKLHSCVAIVSAQCATVDYAAAHESIAQAQATAQSPSERQTAAFAQAILLRREGRVQDARAALEKALADGAEVTPEGLELAVLLGRLCEELEDQEAAETAYKAARKSFEALSAMAGPRARDLYREASLRLSRIYRAAGRSRDAEALVRSVRYTLD